MMDKKNPSNPIFVLYIGFCSYNTVKTQPQFWYRFCVSVNHPIVLCGITIIVYRTKDNKSEINLNKPMFNSLDQYRYRNKLLTSGDTDLLSISSSSKVDVKRNYKLILFMG